MIGEFGLIMLSFKHSRYVYVEETNFVNYFELCTWRDSSMVVVLLHFQMLEGKVFLYLLEDSKKRQEAPLQNVFLPM